MGTNIQDLWFGLVEGKFLIWYAWRLDICTSNNVKLWVEKVFQVT